MNILKQFPSKYLNVAALEELGGECSYTIKSVVMEDMKNAGQSEMKPVMYFQESKQGFVISKSNAITLAESLGPDTTKSPGKAVVIRLENWGPAANKKKWMACYADGAFQQERRVPTLKEAAKAAQSPLDDLDDDISDP
jgi:hypothetical protein